MVSRTRFPVPAAILCITLIGIFGLPKAANFTSTTGSYSAISSSVRLPVLGFSATFSLTMSSLSIDNFAKSLSSAFSLQATARRTLHDKSSANFSRVPSDVLAFSATAHRT